MMAILAVLLLATVGTTSTYTTAACNGASTGSINIPFPYQSYLDLVVTSATSGGAATILSAGADWTISATSTTTTATLVLTNPTVTCPVSNTLTVTRVVALTQPTSFRSQTTYLPSLHERVADRLLMQIQQLSDATITLNVGSVHTWTATNTFQCAAVPCDSILAYGGGPLGVGLHAYGAAATAGLLGGSAATLLGGVGYSASVGSNTTAGGAAAALTGGAGGSATVSGNASAGGAGASFLGGSGGVSAAGVGGYGGAGVTGIGGAAGGGFTATALGGPGLLGVGTTPNGPGVKGTAGLWNVSGSVVAGVYGIGSTGSVSGSPGVYGAGGGQAGGDGVQGVAGHVSAAGLSAYSSSTAPTRGTLFVNPVVTGASGPVNGDSWWTANIVSTKVGGAVYAIAPIKAGTIALSSASPSTATVPMPIAGMVCTCTETTTAANNGTLKCVVSSTTLTITGPNAVTDTIAYVCVVSQ